VKPILLFLFLVVFSGCAFLDNKELTDSEIEYIHGLGLLDKDEIILIFSSSLTPKNSGNFVTNKRIATYWLKDDILSKDFAFFNNISNIDSMNLTEAWTYASYLNVTKLDGSSFKVYVSGGKKDYFKFLNIAEQNWLKNK
jgi:hypothetical protein